MGSVEVSPDQLALLAAPAPVTAPESMDRAVWAGICDAAIEAEAATGKPFTAYEMAIKRGVPEAPHKNHWGLRFQAAHRRGLIVHLGYRQGQRRTVAGSAVSVWKGAPAEIRDAGPDASGPVEASSVHVGDRNPSGGSSVLPSGFQGQESGAGDGS